MKSADFANFAGFTKYTNGRFYTCLAVPLLALLPVHAVQAQSDSGALKKPVHVAQASKTAPAAAKTQNANNKKNLKKSKHWYAGASVGRGGYKTSFSSTNATLLAAGATSFTVTANGKDTMGKAFVGYQYNPWLAVEAGYWDFGGPSYVAGVTAPAATTFQRNFRARGFGLDAVLTQPFAWGFSGFAKGGVMLTMAEASAVNPGGGLAALPEQSVNKFRPKLGMGLSYEMIRNLDARIEVEKVYNIGDEAKFGKADVIMWSMGLKYNF